jgi:hypothetical protein
MDIAAHYQNGLAKAIYAKYKVMDVTCDRRVDRQHIGLRMQYLSRFVQNIHRLLLAQAAFPVKMVLEECNIGFRRILARKELRLGWYAHSRRLNLFQSNRSSITTLSKEGRTK